MAIDFTGLLYAAFIIVGGLVGYFKAGSIPSLGAGLLFGSALTYGAWQVSQNPSNYSTQLATSSILAGVMGYRFYNSGKIMPAGVVCVLSIAMIVRIALRAANLSGQKVGE